MTYPDHREDKGHVLFISTTDRSADSQLRGQLGFLRRAGWRCTLVTTDTGIGRDIAAEDDVDLVPLRMRRDPAPVHDLVALVKIVRLLRRRRPDVVVYGTPKASLLGALASVLAHVPVRIYFLYGLRLETTRGLGRRVLTAIERFVILASTDTLSVGHGLVTSAGEAGLPEGRLTVLGRGSANGVRVDHYRARAAEARVDRDPSSSRAVVGFVGRLTLDKGIDQLLLAVAMLRARGVEVEVMLVGPDEGTAHLPDEARALLREDWVSLVGDVADTAPWYGRMDVLCLPSLREGLPTVVLEAAAAGTPVVVTDFTGASDVVTNSVTGEVVPIGDLRALSEALERVLDPGGPARRYVEAAGRMAREEFDSPVVWQRLEAFYTARREATSR